MLKVLGVKYTHFSSLITCTICIGNPSFHGAYSGMFKVYVFMFYISSCTVQYYFVLSTTAHVRLLHVNKKSQSISHIRKDDFCINCCVGLIPFADL